jgi:hypothetical protein
MNVIFENNGEIDERAITIMGASVKTEKSIGYFGTGLKFSIACILRHGCSIEIYKGDKVLRFKSKQTKIRDKDFDLILMNRKELSFTTQLGRDWELWQAFRELHSNCLDEGGRTYLSDVLPTPEAGKTYIIVSGESFVEQYKDMDNIFIPSNIEPIEKNIKCEVFEGNGVFYRGVKVKENVNALKKYNVIEKIDLTEDRTAKYDFQINQAVALSISQSSNERYIEACCTANYGDCLEAGVNLSEVSIQPSPTYMKVVEWLIKNRPFDINETAKNLYEKFSPKIEPIPISLNDIEKAQLEKALILCDKLGFPARRYPIDVYETLGKGTLAAAHTHENGRNIMLSKEIFTKGIMTLTRGLVEEYIHMHHGYEDYSVEMQNFIFDHMVNFGMHSIGEVA